MGRAGLYLAAAAVILTSSCSPPGRSGRSDGPVIKYMNLSAVYQHAFNTDPDALKLKKDRDSLMARMKKTGGRIENSPEEKQFLEELKHIKAREKKLKQKLYGEIDEAVKSVARRENADFVLNRGDAVIYARRSFDVTGLIIRELGGSTAKPQEKKR